MLNWRKPPAGGFSLTEMAVAVAVLAILLSLATPSFVTWMQNARIRTAAEAAQSGLALARSEAVRRNTNIEFVLGADLKGGWTVRTAAPVASIQTRPAGEGSANVTLSVNPGGALTATFDSFGRALAANADGSPRPDQIDFAGPAAGNRNLRVLVGLGGLIRLCDPAVSDANDPRKC